MSRERRSVGPAWAVFEDGTRRLLPTVRITAPESLSHLRKKITPGKRLADVYDAAEHLLALVVASDDADISFVLLAERNDAPAYLLLRAGGEFRGAVAQPDGTVMPIGDPSPDVMLPCQLCRTSKPLQARRVVVARKTRPAQTPRIIVRIPYAVSTPRAGWSTEGARAERACRVVRTTLLMPAATPADRSLVAQIAAAERWGRTPDRAAATAPARAGLRAKFAREIDPDGRLPVAELERRVDQLVRAHMLRMSLKAKAGRKKVGDGNAAA